MNGQNDKEKQVTTDPEPKEQPKEQPQPSSDTDNKQDAGSMISRSELGAIVKKQLSEARKQWEEDTKKQVEAAKEDGRQEATMSAQELAKKHAEEREKQYQEREDQLNKRLAELDHREHIAHTKDLLAEKHLPTGIAEMVLGETEEETKSNIEQYAQLVDQGIRNAIHQNSAQNEPQNGGAPEVPQKKFSDMSLDEQTELYRKDPELYRQLLSQSK